MTAGTREIPSLFSSGPYRSLRSFLPSFLLACFLPSFLPSFFLSSFHSMLFFPYASHFSNVSPPGHKSDGVRRSSDLTIRHCIKSSRADHRFQDTARARSQRTKMMLRAGASSSWSLHISRTRVFLKEIYIFSSVNVL